MFWTWWWRTKEKVLGLLNGIFETYTRYSALVIKSIKKILVAFNVSFETYIGYSGLNDEQQKKVYWVILLKGVIAFFLYLFRGPFEKKKNWENPAVMFWKNIFLFSAIKVFF